MFGKTMVVHESPALNRVARLQGRATPRASKTVDRPVDEWTEIPVPAIISEDTFTRVAQRLADNKRFASRNSRNPLTAARHGRLREPAATATTAPPPAPPTRRSTTTGAWAATTTATKPAGSAPTSRCAPTTSTPWSGTTSPRCWPTPP